MRERTLRVIRETEEFLERELNRDTIPCPQTFGEEREEALYDMSASQLLHQPPSLALTGDA